MWTKLKRLTHSFTFRFAVVYVAVFALSVAVLCGFMYGYATRYLDHQASDAVRSRYGVLIDEYRQGGSSDLEKRIGEMVASDDDGIEIYLLINNKNEKLAGNLEEWPQYATQEGKFEKDGQWLRFSIEGTRNHPGNITVKAVAVPISKWRTLLVGQSLINMRKVEQTILQAFFASLALTLLMAFIGAVVMTRSVVNRLSIINRSAHTIMHGEISARIPYTRGGDEFDELSMNLNLMLDKIEALLQSLSQFANNIAHDLRSPLTRIITRTEAGLRGLKEGAAARRLLEKNVEDMQLLIGTFNSILKISELEANSGFQQFELCDLRWIISQLVEFYEPYASEKSITLESRLDRPLYISGEKNLLTQMFANLIDNAIKFTPEDGKVTVYYKAMEDETEIIIADTGPGIPEGYRNKVFEKFFRMEASRHTHGNGLGLSLVAAIARIHAVQIRLEDNHPGLRIRFIFPQAARREYTPPRPKED